MNSIAFILDGHCSVDIFFFFFLGCFWIAPFINMYIYIYILSISFSYVPLIFPIYIYIYIHIYIINFFQLRAFNFSYIKYASPLPHALKCAPPCPWSNHFLKKLWLHVTPPIFTAILTCSTIKTIPFRFSKKKILKKKRFSKKNKEKTKDFLY